MTDDDVLADLKSLRSALAAERLTVEEVAEEFETLTYKLATVSKSNDGKLRSLVNEVERIRFTTVPENQLRAVQEVLERAQALFEQLAG